MPPAPAAVTDQVGVCGWYTEELAALVIAKLPYPRLRAVSRLFHAGIPLRTAANRRILSRVTDWLRVFVIDELVCQEVDARSTRARDPDGSFRDWECIGCSSRPESLGGCLACGAPIIPRAVPVDECHVYAERCYAGWADRFPVTDPESEPDA